MSTCEFLTTKTQQPCDSYIKPGMCSREDMFRCPEYISKFEPTLSYSGCNSFMRCPLRYYYSAIKGLQVKEAFQSDPLKIGSMVDEWITGKDGNNDPALDELWFMKSQAIFDSYLKLVKVNIDNYQGQHKFLIQEDGQPSIQGYIDLHAPDHFIELKCGGNPLYYINKFWIRSQMGTYFLSNPDYQYGIVWAIKVPGLKRTGQYKDESLEDYRDRCVRVMVANPKEYFPGYNKDDGTFGVKFYRHEFDLEGLKKRYRMIAWQIQKCIDEGYWYPNETGCMYPFECDYKRVCENDGVISESIYEYRKKGG